MRADAGLVVAMSKIERSDHADLAPYIRRKDQQTDDGKGACRASDELKGPACCRIPSRTHTPESKKHPQSA
jgi:hypothetical protein